jgi:hypothetical protein
VGEKYAAGVVLDLGELAAGAGVVVVADLADEVAGEIGRASCRERVLTVV